MLRYRIVQDDDPMSPAEWDMLTTVLLAPSTHCEANGRMRYEVYDYGSVERLRAEYDALALSLVRFSDYGSGGVRLSIVDDISNANGVAFITAGSLAKTGAPVAEDGSDDLLLGIRQDVETWDTYFRGDVYGVIIENVDDEGAESGEHVDSLWGLYGYEYAETEAREMLSAAVEAAERERVEREYWLARDVETEQSYD